MEVQRVVVALSLMHRPDLVKNELHVVEVVAQNGARQFSCACEEQGLVLLVLRCRRPRAEERIKLLEKLLAHASGKVTPKDPKRAPKLSKGSAANATGAEIRPRFGQS